MEFWQIWGIISVIIGLCMTIVDFAIEDALGLTRQPGNRDFGEYAVTEFSGFTIMWPFIIPLAIIILVGWSIIYTIKYWRRYY